MTSNYASDIKLVKKLKEKKKSRMNSSENDTRDSSKCTAIEIDTINSVRDQMFPDLTISEAVATYLADDVTHKIREIMHNARTKIKHTKRRTLLGKDLDSVMELANIQRIYGPMSTEWKFSDGHYIIDDPMVNLFDLAFQAKTFIQDSPPILTCHSISTNIAVEHQYYENICKCIFSNNTKLATIALKNLKENKNIGNLVDLFATFCFLAFIVDKGHKKLILKMLNNLVYNPHISVFEPGNGLKLVCAFLVSELFPANLNTTVKKSTKTIEYEEEVTNLLIFLITRWKSLEPVVLLTLEKYINLNVTNVNCVSMNIIRIICQAGIEITSILFWNKLAVFRLDMQLQEIIPNEYVHKFDFHTATDLYYDLKHCLWYASSYLFRTLEFPDEWSKEITQLLGGACVPLYPHFGMINFNTELNTEKLTKKVTIRKICKNVTKRKYHAEKVFEDYGILIRKPIIDIKYGKCISAKQRIEYQPIPITPTFDEFELSTDDDTHIETEMNTDFVIINSKYLPSLDLIDYELPKKPNTCKCHNLLFVI